MNYTIPAFSNTDGLIMACHITGVYDVNRNNILQNNDYELVRNWAESVAALGLNGIIFHNNFSSETCNKYQNKHIAFVQITYDRRFNPNVYRYFVYQDFLQQYADRIKNIFVTDVSDVVVAKNPFVEPFFIDHPNALFCGDEPKKLNNDWMLDHATHLRQKIADYADYERVFEHETLLNCGIIGGKMPVFKDFIQKLWAIHQQFNCDNNTAYTGDMGAFNYLARTQFNTQLKHGAPINTVFKLYENERMDCWFRHK
jgi:hypothetical protein